MSGDEEALTDALFHSMLVEKRPSDQPTHRRPMIKFKLVKETMQPRELHSLLISDMDGRKGGGADGG